jgi:cytochrome b involved in lipid metabolism
MKKVAGIIIAIILIIIGVVSVIGLRTRNGGQVSTPSSGAPIQKMISVEEVAKHNSGGDCWMAIDGSVYDVTKYIPMHPGGNEMLRGCGQDATELFNTHGTPGGNPHSPRASNMLKEYVIGILGS